jgi:hypothetical protein
MRERTTWGRPRSIDLFPSISPPKPEKTPITTLLSGQSTGESKPPVEPEISEDARQIGANLSCLDILLSDDPYWPVCVALWRLLSRKRGYYGCVQHPLQNALGVAEDGIIPWVYQVARIGEKCRRLRGTLGTLAIRETLMDIAGHAVVAIACLNHAEPPQKKDET